MTNIINIKEIENRLEIEDSVAVIVCGNSNYILKFTFDEAWQNCLKKAAIFVVDGKKITIDFDGDECSVPVLPNGSFVKVSLISNDGENQLATTDIKIRLEPTIAAANMSEFDQVANYLSKLVGTINKIEKGDLSVAVSECAENVSNSNILINGDFRINQREFSSTSEAKTYTIDRWQNNSSTGTTTLNSDGTIKIEGLFTGSGRFSQALEKEAIKNLFGNSITLSAMVSLDGGTTFKLITNTYIMPNSMPETYLSIDSEIKNDDELVVGYLSIRFEASNMWCDVSALKNCSIIIKYVKLECGKTATINIPRAYAEELLLCQRYFVKYKGMLALSGYTTSNGTKAQVLLPLPCALRVIPTINVTNIGVIRYGGKQYTATGITIYSAYNNSLVLDYAGTFESYITVSALLSTFELDAEIY